MIQGIFYLGPIANDPLHPTQWKLNQTNGGNEELHDPTTAQVSYASPPLFHDQRRQWRRSIPQATNTTVSISLEIKRHQYNIKVVQDRYPCFLRQPPKLSFVADLFEGRRRYKVMMVGFQSSQLTLLLRHSLDWSCFLGRRFVGSVSLFFRAGAFGGCSIPSLTWIGLWWCLFCFSDSCTDLLRSADSKFASLH
ncbi:unnamed protein product [Trifolium pratense]|uniref:Uncharacterized protein n=1 Tax=Trifolium pratense TaxID=57577 RepID=A0ACB0KXX4_TRIPR|nr:unnamed protein product [Trifolium pratense]